MSSLHPFAFVSAGIAALALSGCGCSSQPAPSPATTIQGDAQRGQTLYAQHCASCHGTSGDGKGPVGAALQPPPAAFTTLTLTAEHILTVSRSGGAAVGKSPLMPAFGGLLAEQDLQDIVAHVLSLPR